jgi:hypothetical protein
MPERVSAKNSANFGHIKLAVFKKINLRRIRKQVFQPYLSGVHR